MNIKDLGDDTCVQVGFDLGLDFLGRHRRQRSRGKFLTDLG
jgi:hypothetical protein